MAVFRSGAQRRWEKRNRVNGKRTPEISPVLRERTPALDAEITKSGTGLSHF
jgi:hypothetical protein